MLIIRKFFYLVRLGIIIGFNNWLLGMYKCNKSFGNKYIDFW